MQEPRLSRGRISRGLRKEEESSLKVQKKSSFFATSLRESGICVVRLDSRAGGYEAKPKRKPCSSCEWVGRDEALTRT